MIYIARYAHLHYAPKQAVDDVIDPWQKVIARMGNSGQSTAAHVHFDLIQLYDYMPIPKHVYRLNEIPGYIIDLELLMQQYHYFIDSGFFGVAPHITTYFGDHDYKIKGKWKFHPGIDLVPIDRKETDKHFDIHWNRSIPGEVVSTGYDATGYGCFLMVKYQV